MPEESRVLHVTDQALRKLLDVRATEPDAEELALVIQVTGVRGASYAYGMHLVRLDAVTDGDHLERHGDLPVVVPAGSVSQLRGATLRMSRDLLNPGLEIDNPNSPSPTILGDGPRPQLEGPVAQRVEQVITGQINPAIASHGGWVELVAVEDDVVYVQIGRAHV